MTKNYLIANRNLHDINPLICGQERCSPGHTHGPATREYYLLHYIVSGNGTFHTGGKSYSLHAGDCFIIHPGEITTYIADEEKPWNYIWVGFETGLSLYRENDTDITLPKQMNESVITLPEIQPIFSSFTSLAHMDYGRESFLCSKIWEIFSVMNAAVHQSHDRTEEYIRHAVSCIETEYMMDLSVVSIAERLNLNRSYFSDIFRKKIGRPPQTFLTDYRMQKAAMFMKDLNYTVTQAAFSSGYSDVFTFSRMFKKKYGLSPKAYKDRHRK